MKQSLLDVLVVDDVAKQAGTICDNLFDDDLVARDCKLVLSEEELKNEKISKRHLEQIFRIIDKLHPKAILVDICLHDLPFNVTGSSGNSEDGVHKEQSATWSGPALMAAIRKKYPKQKMASYSAFTGFWKPVEDSIRKQRAKYRVAKTPHWQLRQITAEAVRNLITG